MKSLLSKDQVLHSIFSKHSFYLLFLYYFFLGSFFPPRIEKANYTKYHYYWKKAEVGEVSKKIPNQRK